MLGRMIIDHEPLLPSRKPEDTILKHGPRFRDRPVKVEEFMRNVRRYRSLFTVLMTAYIVLEVADHMLRYRSMSRLDLLALGTSDVLVVSHT